MKAKIGAVGLVCLLVLVGCTSSINTHYVEYESRGDAQDSNVESETPSQQSIPIVKSGNGDNTLGGLANSPWPMFRHDLNHTGQSPYDTSGNMGKLKWNFSTVLNHTRYNFQSSAAISLNGTIYVGCTNGKLYLLNQSGGEVWNFTMGDTVSSPAIGSDGTIYIGSSEWQNDQLYAVNPNGTQKWTFKTGDSVQSSPAIGLDGTIYVGSMDNKLYAINPDGSEKWNFTTGDMVYSSPAIGTDGTIYVGSWDSKLYAINSNGTQRWNYTTASSVWSSPAIGSDGLIYFGSDRLYALNADGSQKWNFSVGSGFRSSPAIAFDGTIYVGSDDNKLYALNPNGTQKWNYTTDGRVYSSPAIGAEGTIFVGSEDMKLHAVNPDGTQRWSFGTNWHVSSSPSIGPDGTIYFGNEDSEFYAIGNASLEVDISATLFTINSAAQSAITSHVTDGMNPISDSIVNLTVDCGGLLVTQNGTTNNNGNFTSIFNAPTVTTQTICRITALANKTGYDNGTGYVDITVNPIPWPMFRHNIRHTALSPYDTSANPGKLKWSFTTSDIVLSSPAIGSDGTIYVGSDDKKLYAINPNGTEKWNFTRFRYMESSPAIGPDGTIYIGSTNNSMDEKFYAINPDGTEKWNITIGIIPGLSGVTSSPAIGADGTIYVGARDHKLYAISPDGTQKWNFTTGFGIHSSPAIDPDGTIYIGSRDNKVYAINPNGTQKWNFTTNDEVVSSPAIGFDGTIYIGSSDNRLYAITPDGNEDWNFGTGDWVSSSPAISADGTIYVGSMDGHLYAIHPNGTEKWSFNAGDPVYSSPAIGSDGAIYVGTMGNKLYAIYSNGTEKWNFTTGDSVHSSPAIDTDGTIYVGSFDCKLYAISVNDPPDARFPGVQGHLEGTTEIIHITDHTPTLNWSYYDREGKPQAQYEVRVGTASGLNDMWSPGVQAGATLSVMYGGLPLLDGTDYWFGIRVFDGAYWSVWNETQFHMNSVLPPTTPIVPLEGTTIPVSLSQTIAWTSGGIDTEGDVVMYYWEVSENDNTFTPVNIIASGMSMGLVSTQFPTQPSTSYYWRVNAIDSWEYSGYGNAPPGYWMFTTFANNVPEAKYLGVQNCLDTSLCILHITDHMSDLNWTYYDIDGNPQTQFEVRVGTLPGLSDIWAPGIQAGAITSVSYAGAVLIDGTDYWFGVRVHDGLNWSAWNETQFHMNAIFAPTTPITPSDGANINSSSSQNITWTSGGTDPEGDTVTYFWEVAADPSFTVVLSSSSTMGTMSTAFETLPSRIYYWRVYANDTWESSWYGNAPIGYWSFTTSSVPEEPPPEEPPPVEFNHKPIIALTFSIILGLVGALVARKRPLRFENESRRRLYTWLTLALPFVLAEALTGIVSGLTGILSVPPLFGTGLLVDLAILLVGIIIFIFQFLRKKPMPD